MAQWHLCYLQLLPLPLPLPPLPPPLPHNVDQAPWRKHGSDVQAPRPGPLSRSASQPATRAMAQSRPINPNQGQSSRHSDGRPLRTANYCQAPRLDWPWPPACACLRVSRPRPSCWPMCFSRPVAQSLASRGANFTHIHPSPPQQPSAGSHRYTVCAVVLRFWPRCCSLVTAPAVLSLFSRHPPAH
jgi:hypothetical protein